MLNKILLLMSLFVSFFSFAQCKQVYKVGIGTSWPPYVMYREELPYGLDIEITQLVFDAADLCIEFVKLPSSARGLNELDKGFIDILPSASFNTDRAKIAYFSEPYRRERMRLFSIRPDESAKNLSELFASDNTFTANPGAYYGEELADILKIDWYKKRLFEVSSLERRMQMVAKERVNYLIEDEYSGLYFVKQAGYTDIKMHSYVVNDNAIHFMLGRGSFSKAQVDAINKVIIAKRDVIEKLNLSYTKVAVKPN